MEYRGHRLTHFRFQEDVKTIDLRVVVVARGASSRRTSSANQGTYPDVTATLTTMVFR